VIDLHTHSTISDGSDLPARISQLAAQAGCTAVALTDHDSLAGLESAAQEAQRCGVTLVPGCEISCRAPVAASPAATGTTASMHVLVYFVEDGEGPLQDELAALRRDRIERNRRLAGRLTELGIPTDYAAMVELAGTEEGLGRPHFAKFLVETGAACDIDDAFDRWLGQGRPASIPKARLDPAQAARLARASGGAAVVAHPLSLGISWGELERLVVELADAGFAGIESFYGRYTPDLRKRLAGIAARAGLVSTGGSDYHGMFKPDLSVGTGQGDLEVPDTALEDLAARCA
jgi:predicted metal-dependent phosphoesterase TrpH